MDNSDTDDGSRSAPTQPAWRTWLPSRGNVLFTLLIVGILGAVQGAGAMPGREPAAPLASNNTIAYQGRLASADGTPLDGSYSMTFKFYGLASDGNALWTESRTGPNAVQVTDGLFAVLLGSVTPLTPSVIANNSSLWLGVAIDGDEEMTPRVQLGSAPFAVQARTLPVAGVTTSMLEDGAVSQFEQAETSASISTSSTTWSTVPGLQITFTTPTTETMIVLFNSADTFIQQSTSSGGFRLMVDGSQLAVGFLGGNGYAANTYVPFHLTSTKTLTPGIHTVSVEWWVQNELFTLTVGAGKGRMIIERFRR